MGSTSRMANRVLEYPFVFNSGWDMRGSDVGTGGRIMDIENMWLSKDDIGAI